MKIRLKEDPREWRKSVWLTCGGLAFVSSVLRWRHVVPNHVWLIALGILAALALTAAAVPAWFRGYYRLSTRAGVALSYVVARVVLSVFFVLVVTPMGLALRLAGKDLLSLKRDSKRTSYWSAMRDPGPLDRMF